MTLTLRKGTGCEWHFLGGAAMRWCTGSGENGRESCSWRASICFRKNLLMRERKQNHFRKQLLARGLQQALCDVVVKARAGDANGQTFAAEPVWGGVAGLHHGWLSG